MEQKFMGHRLTSTGIVEGAIPILGMMQPVMKQLAEGQERFVMEQCVKLDIDPEVLKKQLVEIRRLNLVIQQKEAQIEKMKCCYNCKHGRIYFVQEIIVDCLANKVNPNNKYENCDKWELAE